MPSITTNLSLALAYVLSIRLLAPLLPAATSTLLLTLLESCLILTCAESAPAIPAALAAVPLVAGALKIVGLDFGIDFMIAAHILVY